MEETKNTVSNVSEVNVVSNIVPEKELHKAQLRALKIFSDAVSCTYGPMGGYTAYSMKEPGSNLKAIVSNYTKDGFTVLKHVDVDKPIEALLKDEIRDICTQVIKTIGDGTTSATMLSYLIFKGLLTLHENGVSKRDIINEFKKVINEGVTAIEAAKRETTLDDIYNIALTSLNGDAESANIIRDIYEKNGMSVFIDVSISNTTDTVVKTYSGMTYESGFISPAFINNPKDNSCELRNAHVYVFESPIDTPEMLSLVNMIIDTEITKPAHLGIGQYNNNKQVTHRPTPTIIISPYISRDANSYIDQLINDFTQAAPERRLPLCLVTNISNDHQFLIDIRAMTGAKFIKKYIDPKAYNSDKVSGLVPTEKTITTFAGSAEKVVVDALSTRIINPKMMYDDKGDYSEFFNQYINELETLLKKYQETNEEIVKIGYLKRRINILKSNMVDLYVGGIGISDRDSLKDSIEDAVLNCRSAAIEGVGYGANFEGLRAFNAIDKATYAEKERVHKDENVTDAEKYNVLLHHTMSSIVLNAYMELVTAIYTPYYENASRASGIVVAMLAQEDESKRVPFNIFTEEFDGKVLTSIKTEPAMLKAIAKIISLLFNTNQFLVPDARFNIYTMETSSTIETSNTTTVIDNSSTTVKEEEPDTLSVEEVIKNNQQN
jgi:chaperonin GroEL (HSP60 family)